VSQGVRPAVLVYRADPEDPPRVLDRASELADLLMAPDREALRALAPKAQAMFAFRAPASHLEDSFGQATELKWIQSGSAGVDRVLFPALVASDVIVTNARGVFDDAIAEWVLGSMLAFVCGIVTSLEDQRGSTWNDDRHTERLAGKRLLVVGPGPIGRATARRASALGMEVAAVGTRARPDELFEAIHGPEDLVNELPRADFVLDSLPLTARTRHLFDDAAFSRMKPEARFINVGRGPTVDEPALVDALRTGRIAGAALDVFEEEPLPVSSPLWTLPNVIVSPHICGDFEGWEETVIELFVDNLRRWIDGEPMRNLVDRAAGYGASLTGP
jgi:phosphoglycerate dehydrogenase-like enzyme